ncbi:hypothetical protein [Frankia sp. AvcI1]|uniref:hypothetical protein n=1 Tax=Frankia sp. AvcI1 TaxID=573496 RepID=UPI002118A804|nr:hypothetical protein [Frankia sp. AvcI1]
MPIVVGAATSPAVSPTGNDGAASILSVAMRVCRLDSMGHIAQGPNNMVVTDQYAKIDFAQDMENGQDTSARNAAGNLAVTWRTPDLPKRLTVSVDLTAPDPELEELLTGGTVLTSNDPPLTAPVATATPSSTGGSMPSGTYSHMITVMNYRGETTPASPLSTTVIGPNGSVSISIPLTPGATMAGIYRQVGASYAQIAVVPLETAGATTFVDTGTTPMGCVPGPPATNSTGGYGTEGYAYPDLQTDPNPCGVSIEAWSRAVIDGGPANPPYIHWVWPRVMLWNKGSRTLDTSPLASSFSGFGFTNLYWGRGPDGGWQQDSSRVSFRRREARYPLPTVGYQPTPALPY